MRIIKIKNLQETADTYCGQEIGGGEYYQLQESEIIRFRGDIKVHNHLSTEPPKLLINNGSEDLNFELGIQHLEGNHPTDVFGRPEYRRIVTQPTWLFAPKSLDYYTSKYDSLYNRKHYGADYYDSPTISDAWLQFYDVTDTELIIGENESAEDFQTRLTANCRKTVLSWETPKPFDVQGALLYIQNEPVNPAWLWCIAAPDVPEEYGGSKPFMGRGMNLQMMAVKHPHIYDAVSASTIQPDPVYHSGKIAIVIKHGLGEQIGIQFIVVGYEG